MVERITVTGRIVDDERELLLKALAHANPRVPLDAECVIGDKWPKIIEIDCAALEQVRYLKELECRMAASMSIPSELLR